MRILVADDSETDRKIIEKLLNKQGECVEAKDGNEAISTFRSAAEEGNPFGLVCLDILMPDLEGHEVLEKMRAVEKELGLKKEARARIIMTTSLDDLKHVLQATSNGCDGYVTKPLDKERLLIELSKFGLVTNWEE